MQMAGKIPILNIGKIKLPRYFNKKTGEQLGFNYYSNKRNG